MLNFSRLQFLNEPKSSKLEDNGFSVTAMREKLEKLHEQFEEVKGEIGKRVTERAEIEERFEAIKEANDREIAALNLKKAVLEEGIADVEREFQTSGAMTGAYGSVTRKVEGLFSLRKKLDEWSRSLASMEKPPERDILKSDPKISEEKSSRPIPFVDLEEDEDRDTKKNLCALEAIDLRESVGNLEVQGYADHQEKREGNHFHASKTEVYTMDNNHCHASQTEVYKMESAICSDQATFMDDKVRVRAPEAGASSHGVINASQAEKDKEVYVEADMEEESNEKIQEAKKITRCGSETIHWHRAIAEIKRGKEETKSSSDDVAYVSKLVKGNVAYVSKLVKGNVAYVSKLAKGKGVCDWAEDDANMEEESSEKKESNEKIQDAKKSTRCGFETIRWHRVFAEIKRGKEETKSSLDDVAYVSKLARGKGVYAWGEDDANMEKETSEKIEKAKEQNEGYDDVDYVYNANIDKGEFVGVEDEEEMKDDSAESDSSHDGLDVWDEMSLMLTENWKDFLVDSSSADHTGGDGGAKNCDHQFIFKDDIGCVCRVCGLIEKGIETIIEYQFGKRKGSGRTYKSERPCGNGLYSTSEELVPDGIGLSENFFEVPIHPRHRKAMKAHQFEGLNFLMSNVMAENPGGCVMAHAPGSGKTFMIISFLQVFMAKYPSAKPLIVLPRGILSTWKKEFQKWQVEDMPLYDFYSSRAERRSQQLEVLKKWGKERSILFLSYKQFTVIVRDGNDSKITEECQKFLLVSPSILILDEGHTTRNDDTESMLSLEKVRTPRKVVLSGTLYQNHVKEVFNVLNLIRPNFLKKDPASSIKRRIMSKVELSDKRISVSDDQFFEAVERTILDNIKLKKKVHIIQDLREMTSEILHYYKGDSLDELPGLVDFTVFLKLSERQKKDIEVLKKCNSRFRIFSEGSAIYLHPRLNSVLKQSGGDGKVDVDKIDLLLKNPSEVGAKARFYLNLLELCESTGEKLLVFSQYLGPLKFLERLTVKVKNYAVGREIFVITGDSNSDIRDSLMEQFNTSSSSRVFFGSIKACGEGISLVGASRIIILDIHLNPSVTRQAIGRAFRPGQERKVYTYRLVAAGSPEEEDHHICFRKECIAKMWFEWNAYRGLKEFEMAMVDVNNCGDMFLEMNRLNADVVSVCKRWGGKEAEKDAFSSVPMLCDGTAEQIEQLQVLTTESDKLDSLGSGQLEIKSGEEVHRNYGVVEGSEKPGNSGSDGQLQMKTGEEVQKRKGGRTRKFLEGSRKQMKSGEEVQKRKRGRPRKVLGGGNTGVVEGSEEPSCIESDGQLLQMKTAGEEEEKDSSNDGFMLPSNVPRKRKKRTVLESDAEYSLPRSHKRAKKEKDVEEELVGSRVKVWWPYDQQYYEGLVESYDPVKNRHKVSYFDGDIEYLILKKEQWLLVDETSDSQQEDQAVPRASAMPAAKSRING